jgi:hypothetical protein
MAREAALLQQIHAVYTPTQLPPEARARLAESEAVGEAS